MKKYFIIGNPISHSLSPTLHNHWFKKYKVDAEYKTLEIDKKNIESVIKRIRGKEISGINITLPYKQEVIPFLDKLVNHAKETNSVNTVYLNSENLVVGDNTDVFGLQAGYFKQTITENRAKQKALILGAGGVAPSVILALNKSNIEDICLINRTYEKAIFLKKRFKKIKIDKWENIPGVIKNFDIIINATSVGLKNGQEFNFTLNNCKKSMVYIDTIYNPAETKMIKLFKTDGIKTFNGLNMFLYQGQKSFYLWNKINPEINDDLIELLKSKL
jgi:shikimate dehydrogenase